LQRQAVRNGKPCSIPGGPDAVESAKAAGLRYVSDASPGIARIGSAPAFRYVRPDGKPVREAETLARIRSLAIPPAWRQVWISPRPDGHLQASGRDARNRKQYRYHPHWREVRDETKYHRMLDFGRALPRIRRRIARDLELPGLPREKALATVVRLLEATYIRVGNEEYARQNDSFGLTTLRGRQVRVDGSTLRFRFRGKSGVQHDVSVADRRLAAIVRRMQDLPGYELFQYLGAHGEQRVIESSDVNAYIKAIAGKEFTSKDFRTWAGTVLATEALRRLPRAGSPALANRRTAEAIDTVARQLRNTRAVCRKCYIHPAVLESYVDGTLHEALAHRSASAAVLHVLEQSRRRHAAATRRRKAGGAPLPVLLRRSLKRGMALAA
jgi:DNA topoisomerase I